MKNIFSIIPTLLTCLFLFPDCIRSQSFDHIFQPSFLGEAKGLTMDNEGNIYLEGIAKTYVFYGNQSFWLTRLNSNGNILLNQAIAVGERLNDAHQIITPEGKIVILFNFQACDLGLYWKIKGLDQNGMEEWEIETEFDNGYDLQIFQNTETSFCIQTPASLFIYNYQGGLISEETNNLHFYNRHILLPTGKILAFNPHVAIFDQLNLMDENQSLSGIIEMKVMTNNSGYAAIDSAELFTLDNSLNVTASINLSNYGEILDFDLAADGYWLLFENQVLHLDASFNILGQLNIPYSGIRNPKFILKNEGKIIIAGDEVPTECIDESQAYFIQSFEDANKLSFIENIGVVEVWTSSPSTGIVNLGFPDTGYDITLHDLHVSLNNTGIDTIHSVSIESNKRTSAVVCEMYFEYNMLHYDLNLAPGETTDISLGDLTVTGQYYIYPFNLCFWANSPNDQTDVDRSDNCLCKDFDVIVSDKDIVVNHGLKISPNPNSGIFKISGIPENLNRLKIYNSTGICVYDARPMVSDGTIDITLSQDLAPGIYFLVSNDDFSGSLSQKIILQNQ
jgi:hypothetical protein